jgi:sugar phosphate permease
MILSLIGFFPRVAPAVTTSELMGAFGISASGLGGLSASYYYSYVILQIPTGVVADSWGPRKLLTAGGMVAAFGTILFSLAPDFFGGTSAGSDRRFRRRRHPDHRLCLQ